MPGTMFQDVVCPNERSNRRWYTLPLSFLAHTAVLAIVIVVPLIATDVLPRPHTTIEFVPPYVPAVPAVPPPPRAVRSLPAAVATGAPVVAPESIGTESGVTFDPGDVPTSGLESIVGGIDVGQIAIETPPTAAPPARAPVRTGGTLKPPARIRYVPPEYPDIAKKNHIQGVVIIDAIIGADGRVENAKVLRGNPMLDGAALEAVKSWEYTPTLLNGTPTAVIMTVTIRFHLN